VTGGHHEPWLKKQVAAPAAAPAPAPNLHASHNIVTPRSLSRSAFLPLVEASPGGAGAGAGGDAVSGNVSQAERQTTKVRTTVVDTHTHTVDLSLKDLALTSRNPASATSAQTQDPSSMTAAHVTGSYSLESPRLEGTCLETQGGRAGASSRSDTTSHGSRSARTPSPPNKSNKCSGSSTRASIGLYFQPSTRSSGLMAVKSVAPGCPMLTQDLVKPGDEVLQIGRQSMMGISMPDFALMLRAACAAAFEVDSTEEGQKADGDTIARKLLLRRGAADCYAVLVDATPSGSKFHSLVPCHTSNASVSSTFSTSCSSLTVLGGDAGVEAEAAQKRPGAEGGGGRGGPVGALLSKQCEVQNFTDDSNKSVRKKPQYRSERQDADARAQWRPDALEHQQHHRLHVQHHSLHEQHHSLSLSTPKDPGGDVGALFERPARHHGQSQHSQPQGQKVRSSPSAPPSAGITVEAGPQSTFMAAAAMLSPRLAAVICSTTASTAVPLNMEAVKVVRRLLKGEQTCTVGTCSALPIPRLPADTFLQLSSHFSTPQDVRASVGGGAGGEGGEEKGGGGGGAPFGGGLGVGERERAPAWQTPMAFSALSGSSEARADSTAARAQVPAPTIISGWDKVSAVFEFRSSGYDVIAPTSDHAKQPKNVEAGGERRDEATYTSNGAKYTSKEQQDEATYTSNEWASLGHLMALRQRQRQRRRGRLLMTRRQLGKWFLRGAGEGPGVKEEGGGGMEEEEEEDFLRDVAGFTQLVLRVWDKWGRIVEANQRVRERAGRHQECASTRTMVAWQQWCRVQMQQRQLDEREREMQLHERERESERELRHEQQQGQRLVMTLSKLAREHARAQGQRCLQLIVSAWARRTARHTRPPPSSPTSPRTPRHRKSLRTRMSLVGRDTVLALRRFACGWIAPPGVRVEDGYEVGEREELRCRWFSAWREASDAAARIKEQQREEAMAQDLHRVLFDVESTLIISVAFVQTLARRAAGARESAGGTFRREKNLPPGGGSAPPPSVLEACDTTRRVHRALPKTEFSSRSARQSFGDTHGSWGGWGERGDQSTDTDFDLSDSDMHEEAHTKGRVWAPVQWLGQETPTSIGASGGGGRGGEGGSKADPLSLYREFSLDVGATLGVGAMAFSIATPVSTPRDTPSGVSNYQKSVYVEREIDVYWYSTP
jgi:hypothetical protein